MHLCVVGGEQERRHLAFRDFLRSHPAVAGEYLLLKQHLATVHRGDSMQSREAYSAAKSAFVESVLKRAIGRCNPHAA
ncbi:hypothetical protein HK414_24030 [Ramlibacter terrae]|uniref:GrpB family protein n=1 Tax=Ramlibacter terrae TaxID=2732511 RepID=A0ABX6P8P0_9BURK|nr:hypothetical protein HK414_24030 [Ramlibacter terrae]